MKIKFTAAYTNAQAIHPILYIIERKYVTSSVTLSKNSLNFILKKMKRRNIFTTKRTRLQYIKYSGQFVSK